MGQPAAKQGDRVTGTDMHVIVPPGAGTPALVPHPFNGAIDGGLSTDVIVAGAAAAVVGSTASNSHVPQGGSFQFPPRNQGRITTGSGSVVINGRPAARNGDTAVTCNDTLAGPIELPNGTVIATGTVEIG
jgi:uncharacterized Zn-binding protein involved in type VI secretion